MREDIRDEVIMGLVLRARTDPEFKRNLHNAFDRLLIDEYRHDLTEAELDVCRDFWRHTLDLTEDELDRRLAKIADPMGPEEGI